VQDVLMRAPALRTLQDRLVEPRVVASIVAVWLGLHAALRLLTGPTLGMDDAEQALAAQAWSWGYRTEQPPLFTWLLLLVQPLAGVGVVAITLLRYAFLGLMCFAYWKAAKAWLGDDARAAVALLALPAMYTFGWYAQVDLTHSTVLATAVAVMLWLAARLAARRRWGDYVLLGLVLGLGILGKWNLAMGGAALVLTGLILPELRRALLHPGTLLAALIAAAIVLPNAYWLLAHKSIEAAGASVLVRGQKTALQSLLDLLLATVAFPQPWLVLALIVFLPALRRHGGRPAASPAVRVLGTYMAVALLLHAALILPFGGVDFSERWMIVPLMPLPILFAAMLDPRDLPIDRWLTVVALMVVLALGIRTGMLLLGGDSCPGRCRILAPFGELARDLRDRGFEGGTIVVDDLHLGGNLRVRFPGSRVVDVTAPPGVFGPPLGTGQCLLAWNADMFGNLPPERLAEGARTKLGVDVRARAMRGQVSALLTGASYRRQSLGYVLYDGPNGDCR
jgi:hypothetical protein